jgi:dipeptidase E
MQARCLPHEVDILKTEVLMRILLGSGGLRTPERVAFFAGQMRSLLGDIDRVLFVPYALRDHDAYLETMAARGLDAGYGLDGIHRHADPVRAVRDAAAIYVGGGNTFRLLDELYRRGLLDAIRERVRAGVPYVGVSAGSNVACPTMQTTNDMPIVQPPSFRALGLVPFQINAHYFNGRSFVQRDDVMHEHFGETRDERLREYHEMNDTPVVGLWEGGALRVEGGRLLLDGAAARVFRKGEPPRDVAPGTYLDELLTMQGRSEEHQCPR